MPEPQLELLWDKGTQGGYDPETKRWRYTNGQYGSRVDVLGPAADYQIIVPGGYPDIEGFTHAPKVTVGGAKQLELGTGRI